MTGRAVSVCLAMLCACCGCVREPALPDAIRDAAQWEQLASMQVRVSVQHLGKVPNSGLLLPAVSPDGRWVAYLEITSGPEVYVDSLFSGKGLEGVSLSVREVRRGVRRGWSVRRVRAGRPGRRTENNWPSLHTTAPAGANWACTTWQPARPAARPWGSST